MEKRENSGNRHEPVTLAGGLDDAEGADRDRRDDAQRIDSLIDRMMGHLGSLPSVKGQEVIAPLERHGVSNTMIGAAAFLPAVGTGRHLVDPIIPAIDNVGSAQLGQIAQPETGALDLAMAMLPRVECLVGLADLAGDDRHRILQREMRDRGIHQDTDEIECSTLPAISDLGREMTRAADCEMCAGREGDQHIPVLACDSLQSIANDMERGVALGGQQVAGPRIEPTRTECVADSRGILAGHEDADAVHLVAPRSNEAPDEHGDGQFKHPGCDDGEKKGSVCHGLAADQRHDAAIEEEQDAADCGDGPNGERDRADDNADAEKLRLAFAHVEHHTLSAGTTP